MQALPLIGGSYSARSVIANAQRCVNLFPETNRKDSPVPTTHYQRPGLAPLVSPAAPLRGRAVYQASNGDGYVVIGSVLYYVSSAWALTALGSLTAALTTPVSMVDNGNQLLVVDGQAAGIQYAGGVNFAVNPSINDTVTFNGVVFTFIAGASSGTNVHIEASVGLTIAQGLFLAVSASVNPLLTVANYSTSAGGGGSVNLLVGYKTGGAAGATYTLAASAATPTAATLTASANYVGGGWYVNLGDHTGATFTAIVDPAWRGADRVDYIDTFLIWNQPGSILFVSSLSNQIVPLDATYVAGKTSWPDALQTLVVNNGQIALLGLLRSEIWYDAGNPLFPFARVQGTEFRHGIAAKYSVASTDVNVFWLGRDQEGQGIVLRLRGYEVQRISNHALEFAIQQMAVISDAVGYCYQQTGHSFYVLSFPTENQTWCWDEAIADPDLGWSQRGWTSSNGTLGRERGAFGAALYGKNVVLDWENGTLYQHSLATYTDTVLGVEYPVQYLRTFPHLMSGTDPATGQPVLAEGKMVQHERFMLNAEMGTNTSQAAAEFTIRYSDDRGKTWDGTFRIAAGELGKFLTRNDGRALGQAMDRVYEASWSFPGQVALNGAWVEGKVLAQ